MGKKKRVAKPQAKPNVISLEMDATFFFERAVRSLDRLHYEKAVKYFRRAAEYEPDNPVNQTMQGFCPLSRLRAARSTLGRCSPSAAACAVGWNIPHLHVLAQRAG